ncbi:adenosine/AMP deaminase-like protein [Breznakia blatticola]|uniref:adenosine deaminase n=2 Tax=Breznakia blatticola TaxID=1754012 RepID=A0A4V3G6S7_9FIRM|nr:adenosine/AMP deaminase-like protein [Breznakia blatticola]
MLSDSIINEIENDLNVKSFNPIHLFIHVSKKILSERNSQILVDFDNLFEWDGCVNKVDPRIIFGAKLSESEGFDCNCKPIVKHDEVRIEKCLKDIGVCDNHMHLNGSGYNWEMNWHSLSTKKMKAKKLEKIAHNREMKDSMEKMQIRILGLKAYLYNEVLNWKFGIAKYIDNRDFLIRVIENGSYSYMNGGKNIIDGLICLWDKKNIISTEDFQYHHKNEVLLFFYLFRMIRLDELSYEGYKVANSYISYLCKCRQMFVQDNNGIGFSKFKDSENIKELFIPNSQKDKLYIGIFDKYYCDKITHKVEFRIAPKKTSDINEMINQLDDANEKVYSFYKKRDPNVKKIDYKLVIHYIKEDHKIQKDEVRNFQVRRKLKEDKKIDQYFSSKRKSREQPHIVGIDTANFELNCPPEVYGPTFRRHRKMIGKYYNLGITYHVGEEFASLASGIRAIDECIEFINLKSGDRLGHAIALGIDVIEYFKIKRNYIITTLQKHVDDLAWLLSYISNTDSIYAELLAEFDRFSYELLGETVQLTNYIDSMSLRSDDPNSIDTKEVNRTKTDKNYDNPRWKQANKNKNAKYLYKKYLSYKQQKKGDEKLCITATEQYMTAVKNVQGIIKEKIYNKRIVIETNPSSNKKISSVKKYINLPLFKFNSKYIEDGTKHHIQTTINTDDSAIFGTDLYNEYSLIALSLIKNGVDVEDVFDYIKYLAVLSNETTFIS